MLNWDEVRHQSQSAYKTDARAVQQKKQTKADSPSSIDWNRVYYTPNILKFQESERAVAAKRSKLAEAKQAAEQAQSEQTQAQRQAEWDNRQQDIASFIRTQQAKQSGAPLMSRIEAEIRSTPESELKDPMVQLSSGVYEATFGKTIDAMNKLGGQKQSAAGILAEVSAPYSDAWRTAGRLYGGTVQNLAMYSTVGKAAEGWSALEGIGSPFLRNLAGQQLADTLIQTPGVIVQGIADKKPVGEVLKDVGIQQGQDLAANLIFGGLEAGLSKLKNVLKKPASELTESTDIIPLQKIPTDTPGLKPTTLPGTYTVKNAAYEKAVQEYNDAIEQIQNHFRTNWLTDNEVARIKPELGIDLEDIISRMEAAEKGVSLPGADAMQLRRAAGVASDRAYSIGEKVAKSKLDVAKTVDDIPPIGGKTTADSIDDQVKKLDEYFQQRRTAPIGGEPMSNAADTAKSRIYGETPKGEIPEGMKERGFSRNIRTDEAMPDDIRQMFDDDPLFYKQVSNKETLGKAQTIFSKGEEAATAEFYRLINDKKYHAEAIPLSKLLAEQALENGNITKAREILSEAADKLTDAGRTAQAAKILREADPETFLMTIDKQLRKLNEQGLKQYGKKWTNIDLLPDEITAIQNIPRGNQQAYEEVWEQIGNRIAKELPSTKMEKFDAWRRMAMLLNPKTHIRNIGGNVIMMGMRKVADTIGAALEKAFGVKTGERTKSFGWSFNKNIASKVDETWEVVKKDILGESRWRIDNLKSLGMEKRIFKTGALQDLNEFSLKTLNAEDNIFTQRAFKDALGQFMQANKLTEATDAAIEYARRRALEATFKQANMLSDFINRAKRTPGIGRLVEGAIPFSKTPANIAARAVEYSPVGLTKLLFSKGKAPAEVIETLSKGLTGSAITALGLYLGASGWAKVERNRSEKAEGLMQEMGDQPNSIITPQGSYTFDWAQPFAVPLAMGIATAEALKNRKDGDTLVQAVWDGIMAGGDTIFNMTMLQNIKQIFSGGSITEKLAWIPVAYIEQAIPSLFGQIARTVDDTRRSTYDPNRLKQEWNKIKSRVPGLSQTLEPALDIWGQEQYQGGALQQFISPGYYKERSDDRVTNEVARLHGEFQDNDMLPKVAPRSFTHKGEKYELTAQQVTEFQRKMGQENYSDIKRLISSAEYQRMTDEEKVKKIKKIVNDNYEEAKQDIIKASALKGN